MKTFEQAVIDRQKSVKTTTTNGMKARKNTGSACVDLYFNIGASRGKDLSKAFKKALVENEDVAVRMLLATRDVRLGKGERQMFRDLFSTLAAYDKDLALRVVKRVPELGRWDDLLKIDLSDVEIKTTVFDMIKEALDNGDGLCAKWMPRKGDTALELRKHFNWSPKFYRKTLVNLTQVVETAMCEKDWESIDFSKVPSKAFANYKRAFHRNTPETFETFLEKVNAGEAKVNASAIFPHDVIKGLYDSYFYNSLKYTKEHKAAIAQWENLPNFLGDSKILPMIDVSGSMTCSAGGSTKVSCMDVALALGLYCAEKNTGEFKDLFVTFTDDSHVESVKGDIFQKIQQVLRNGVGYSTDITSAFESILRVAKKSKVPQENMPEYLVIFSDMQFNESWTGRSCFGTMKKLYKDSGYNIPKVIFWNLNASGNVPVKFSKDGAALVSGFSPSLMKAILSCDEDSFTPEGIMLKDLMNSRYDY